MTNVSSPEAELTSVTVRPKILVVNDSPDFLTFMREFLTIECGYEVATLDQSEGVIEQVSCSPPSLIILDVVFRGARAGYEIADQLAAAADTAGIPILFCTALSEREILPETRSALVQRGHRLLHKPFDVEDLLASIDALLEAPAPSSAA